MALPSARRPKEVEEELEERVETQKRVELKIHLSKGDIFLKMMMEWYEGLSKKQKKTLTPKLLKRRAIVVAYSLQIPYDRLPKTWVEDLKTKCGMKLYEKKRKKKAMESPKEGPQDVSLLTSRTSLSPSTSGGDGDTADSSVSSQPLKKKFVDLSDDPPPPQWLAACANGVILPRELTLYSTEDSNILFYDYTPKLKDSFGREVKLTTQPRHDVSYFKKPWLL